MLNNWQFSCWVLLECQHKDAHNAIQVLLHAFLIVLHYTLPKAKFIFRLVPSISLRDFVSIFTFKTIVTLTIGKTKEMFKSLVCSFSSSFGLCH